MSKTPNGKTNGLSDLREIKTGGFVLFPEVMRHSENYIQKDDGSFRNAVLISQYFKNFFDRRGT